MLPVRTGAKVGAGRAFALTLAYLYAAASPAVGAAAGVIDPMQPFRPWVGVELESAWYAQRWAFLGLGGRAILASSSTPAALVLEGAWLRERDGDDEILLLGGAAVVRLPLEGGGSFDLGVGVGWLRWRDTYGWDRGVWDRVYRELRVGAEVPLAPLLSGLPVPRPCCYGFIELGILPPGFHPAVSVGVLLPLPGSS